MEIKEYLSEHLPEVYTGCGIGLMITGAFLACKATLKAHKKLEEKRKVKGDKLTVWETVKTAGPEYILATAAEAGGAILVGKGLGKQMDKTATVTAALAFEEAARRSFEEKAKEVIGEKKVNEIRDEVAKEQAAANNVPMLITKKDGQKVFVDTLVGKEFYLKSTTDLDKLQLEVEKDILNFSFISVNEWLSKIGICITDGDGRTNPIFDELGWGTATGFDLKRTWIETDDGEPCCLITHTVQPKPRKEAEGCW